jgi:hypothetical protein
MVVKDLKEMFQKWDDGKEDGSEEGDKSYGDDDSLFNLVRGSTAKGKKNMLTWARYYPRNTVIPCLGNTPKKPFVPTGCNFILDDIDL